MQTSRMMVLLSLGILFLCGCQSNSSLYRASKSHPHQVRYVETEDIQRDLATEEDQELADEI